MIAGGKLEPLSFPVPETLRVLLLFFSWVLFQILLP